MKCCICGKEINGYGNNPSPLKGDLCCDECNINVVVPYRMFINSLSNSKNLAMLVKPDRIELVKPKGKYYTLKELQNYVEGYIEIAFRVFDETLTVVNEEGLIKRLSYNHLTKIMFNLDLVGNVLICPSKIFEEPEE